MKEPVQFNGTEDNSTSISPNVSTEVVHTDVEKTAPIHHVNQQNAATFDPKAETRLRRKIDIHVIPILSLLHLLCYINRTNIGNAKLIGFEEDFDMIGLEYNEMLSIFYVSYIVFEPPSVLLCKKIGPGWFLPAATLGFGVISLATAFSTTFATCAVCRFLLGAFEAGMMPGTAYYLSRWYRQAELAFRLALCVVFAPLAGAFGGLLAGAILRIPGIWGLDTWRMLFAVEGLMTIGVGILAFPLVTDRPDSARWLSAEQKELAVNRILSERPGTTEVIDKMSWPKLRRGLSGPVTIMTAVIYFLVNVTGQGLALFAPMIVKSIYPGYSVVSQQLYTAPPYVVGAFFTLLIPFMSWKSNTKVTWFIPCGCLMIFGYIIFLSTSNSTARYAATFFIASGAFPFGAMANAHAAANTISDTSRATAIATVIFAGHLGGFCSSWSFTPNDGPGYPIGNGLNLATSSTLTILSVFMYLWIKSDNKRRDRIEATALQDMDHMTQGNIQALDWHQPCFRWKL